MTVLQLYALALPALALAMIAAIALWSVHDLAVDEGLSDERATLLTRFQAFGMSSEQSTRRIRNDITWATLSPEPEPTIVKAGSVNDIAYVLYSDGSIKARMHSGDMQFASIDELQHYMQSHA
jgi:hypothetical protein